MMETRQIVGLWKRQPPDCPGVLITLVHIEGSSYRRPGARLLLLASGESAGTISGGCLEAEVVRKAFWKTRNGAILETYSTLFDDTAEIPYGLGCGGTVQLLLEPLATPEANAILAALDASLQGSAAEIDTWLPVDGRPLRRLLRTPQGSVLFSSAPGGLSSAPSEFQPEYRETILPPQRLVILGAGEDARPLAALAGLLGWRITVAEGRSQLTQPERFPAAEHVVTLHPGPRAGTSAAPLNIDSRDAVVLMTHSFEQDRDLLREILPKTPRYLGLLGSRHRSSLLLADASEHTGLSLEACCNRVFAPVGLDLGGDGPHAIALAILAEIQAVCAGNRISSRRLSPADVANQLASGRPTRYPEASCALDNPLIHPVDHTA